MSEWQTTKDWRRFLEIKRILNSQPLAPRSDDPDDLAYIFTPNSLLVGKLDASLQMDKFIKSDSSRKNWRGVGWLSDRFWERWVR